MDRTRTRTPEEVDWAKAPSAVAVVIAVTVEEITWLHKYAFEGKIKDDPIFKLLITKTGYRPIQYKNIIATLPVLCIEKNFWGLDEVIQTEIDLVETDFMPPYLDANQWSTIHHVQVSTVNLTNTPDVVTGECPVCFEMMEQTHVFDANLQKEFLAKMKALIMIIFGQCDEATKTKIVLGAIYPADLQAGRLIEFLNQLHSVSFGRDYIGLSYGPSKQVVAVKLMNNYTNNEPHKSHDFKE